MEKNNKELLTADVVENLDRMLRKLAMQRITNGHLKMEFEDVVSELWINALKIIDKLGRVDYNYIAKSSIYKMVDYTRHNVAHEATPMPDTEFDMILPEDLRNQQPNTGAPRMDAYIYSTTKPMSADERMNLLAILDLFEKDSKEYIYVESWMKILGIIEVEDVTALPERAFDGFIAVDMLGYAASKSNGYNRLRKKVREVLREAGYEL